MATQTDNHKLWAIVKRIAEGDDLEGAREGNNLAAVA